MDTRGEGKRAIVSVTFDHIIKHVMVWDPFALMGGPKRSGKSYSLTQ